MKKSYAVLMPLSVSAKKPTNDELLSECRKLDDEIHKLTAEKDNIREEMKRRYLEQDDKSPIQSNRGKFTFIAHGSWNYTAKVAELKAKVESQQKIEQVNGKAEFKPAPYVKFEAQNFVKD